MGFGPVTRTSDELKQEIIRLIENKCIMDEEYVLRVNGFFKYVDDNNSERVIDAILESYDEFYY